LKPKSKTQKKTEANIVRALNEVCESSLDDVQGFRWLTHQVDYTNFPASLLITCVFESDEELQRQDSQLLLKKRIQAELLAIGVRFKSINQQVVFDSEAACDERDQGDWEQRLQRKQGRSVPRNRPLH